MKRRLHLHNSFQRPFCARTNGSHTSSSLVRRRGYAGALSFTFSDVYCCPTVGPFRGVFTQRCGDVLDDNIDDENSRVDSNLAADSTVQANESSSSWATAASTSAALASETLIATLPPPHPKLMASDSIDSRVLERTREVSMTVRSDDDEDNAGDCDGVGGEGKETSIAATRSAEAVNNEASKDATHTAARGWPVTAKQEGSNLSGHKRPRVFDDDEAYFRADEHDPYHTAAAVTSSVASPHSSDDASKAAAAVFQHIQANVHRHALPDMPRILFFGGDQVAIASLTALCDKMLERLASLGGGGGSHCGGDSLPPASVSSSSKDYSLLAPFLEVVCPTAPPIEELSSGSTSSGNTQSASANPPSAQYSHSHFLVPRFCNKHSLKCHIVDHRASLAKSSIDFDSILYGVENIEKATTEGGSASSSSAPGHVDKKTLAATENALDAIFGLPHQPTTVAAAAPAQTAASHTTSVRLCRPEGHDVLVSASPNKGKTVDHVEQQQRECRFDVAVVVSFRYFISDALLRKLPPVINVHPSLLPKYRGCSPIFSTMLRGDSAGGASIIKICPQEAMDSGDILLQRSIPIDVNEDMRSYFPKLMALAGQTLGDVLFPVFPVPQPIAAAPLGVGVLGVSPVSKNPHTGTPTALAPVPPPSPPSSHASMSNTSVCHPSPTAPSVAFLRRPMPWRPHFEKLWANATEQTNKIHYKLDPFYAPMIPRHRATHMCWEKVSGTEAYNMWRAFVGGQFFGPVSASLEKRATPVAEQLRTRAISKYMKQQERQHRAQQQQQKMQRGSGVGSQVEQQTPAAATGCADSHVGKSNSEQGSAPPTFPPPPPEVIEALLKTHVTFLEAKCPSQVCPKTHALLAKLSSGALIPGAACFPSTDESIVAIMCGRQSKVSVVPLPEVEAAKRDAKMMTKGDGALGTTADGLSSFSAASSSASASPAVSYHASRYFYPNSEVEWFFAKELMLQGSKGPTKPAILRTSLAMKKDVIYPYLFTSEKNAWTIDEQQAKSQGRRLGQHFLC